MLFYSVIIIIFLIVGILKVGWDTDCQKSNWK